MRQESDDEEKNKLSRFVAADLGPLFESAPVGADVSIPADSSLCSSLELFLPALLRSEHPKWRWESLDGLFVEQATRVSARSMRLWGACILISDQTLTPFMATLEVSTSGESIAHCELYLGEPGEGELGISGPKTNSRNALSYRSGIAERLERIKWIFAYPRRAPFD